MRNKISIKLLRNIFALVVALTFAGQIALAQTSSFTYQGKLADSGVAANGTYDITFKLYDTLANGTQVGTDVVRDNVVVSDGGFTVDLDFGAAAFASGASRFLQLEVRPGASVGIFTPLVPRQPLTSSPYAVKAASASFADSLSAACALCVTDAHIFSIDGGKVTGAVANATNVSGGTVSGNGSGLTNLSGGNLASNSITADKFSEAAVTEYAIRDGNVTTTKIADGAVTNSKLAGGSVDATHLTALSVTSTALGDGSVKTAKIGDGAVTTEKIADGAITKSKLATDFKNGFDPQKVALMRWDQISLTPHFAEVGRVPSALAFDGTFMYVANKLDNNVMRLRTSTGLIEGSPIAVGNAPAALVYDGFGSIWVANLGGGTVSRISISGIAVDMTVDVGSQPCSLGFDGNLIYVGHCNSNQVTRITRAGAIVGSVTVGHKTVSLAFDGTHMYVAEPNNLSTGASGNVRRINAATGAVSLIPGPNGAGGFPAGALAFDGTFIYVAQGNAVQRIRAATGLPESNGINFSSPISANAMALAFDGTFMYASGYEFVNVASSRPRVLKLNINGLGNDSLIAAQGSIPNAVTALAFDGTYIYAASDVSFVNGSGQTVNPNGAVTRF